MYRWDKPRIRCTRATNQLGLPWDSHETLEKNGSKSEFGFVWKLKENKNDVLFHCLFPIKSMVNLGPFLSNHGTAGSSGLIGWPSTNDFVRSPLRSRDEAVDGERLAICGRTPHARAPCWVPCFGKMAFWGNQKREISGVELASGNQMQSKIPLLIGGLEHFVFLPYIGNMNPNWLIFFRGLGQPPTRLVMEV